MRLNNTLAAVMMLAVCLGVCAGVVIYLNNTSTMMLSSDQLIRITRIQIYRVAGSYARTEISLEKLSLSEPMLTITKISLDGAEPEQMSLYGNPLALKGDTSLLVIYDQIPAGEHILGIDFREAGEAQLSFTI